MRPWVVAVSMGCALAATVGWGTEKAKLPPMKDVPKDMRTYYVAFLVAGPKFAPDSPARGELMPKHLAFIRQMISEKKVRLAGPFAEEGKLFGIAIVDAASADEARAWMDKDPAVQAGFFDHEIHPAMLPGLESLHIRY